ncbi:hypothetical protein ABEX25_16235 [Paenibacillus thiaminolyticus]|uniref:hypothetical protein n=1 Tax=Paenibacillus thiaminolyticus TaxID=49283 RepID=UPI003D26E28C
MLLSSQVAMAAPSAASNALNKAQQHSATASNDTVIQIHLKVGEGRQLAGSGFWTAGNTGYIDLYADGYVIALKPGKVTAYSRDSSGNLIIFGITITA